jgi:hypothetical protein
MARTVLQSLLSEGSRGAVRGIANLLIVKYGPVMLAGLTAALGFAQGMPWAYIIVAASAAFAFISWGLLNFHNWNFQRSAEFKLITPNPVLGKSIRNEEGTSVVRAAKVAITLQHISSFPLEFNIDRISTMIGGRVNPRPEFRTKSGIIQPNTPIVYWDAEVDITGISYENLIEGKFDVGIRYGKQGDARYALNKQYDIFIKLKQHGEDVEGFDWFDTTNLQRQMSG